MTPTSLLAIMPNKKEEIKTFSEMLLSQIKNGEIEPLKIHVQLKAIESVIKKVNESDEYKNAIRSESEKHGKSFNIYGAKIDLAEVGTKYDYSGCNHLEYSDICQEIERLEGNKKAIETLLKAIKGKTGMVIYGEVRDVNPPVKSSTSSIKVTF
jgi:hypothetical protein